MKDKSIKGPLTKIIFVIIILLFGTFIYLKFFDNDKDSKESKQITKEKISFYDDASDIYDKAYKLYKEYKKKKDPRTCISITDLINKKYIKADLSDYKYDGKIDFTEVSKGKVEGIIYLTDREEFMVIGVTNSKLKEDKSVVNSFDLNTWLSGEYTACTDLNDVIVNEDEAIEPEVITEENNEVTNEVTDQNI